MDFIIGCLNQRGFIPLKRPYSTCSLATFFTKEIVKFHDRHASIVRDHIFVSNFWQKLFKLQETHFLFKLPPTDGRPYRGY